MPLINRPAAISQPLTYDDRLASIELSRAVKHEIAVAHAKAVKLAKAKAAAAKRAAAHRRAVRYAAPVSVSGIKAYALSLVGASQFGCLDQLWNRESGWRVTAANPSGAYGIPQALPGSKMGPGWQTNAYVQVRWGVSYIAARYHNACGAWAHSEATGWY